MNELGELIKDRNFYILGKDGLENIWVKYTQYLDCLNIHIINRIESADIDLSKNQAIELRNFLNEFIEDNNG